MSRISLIFWPPRLRCSRVIFPRWREALRETRILLCLSLAQLALSLAGALYLSRTYYLGLRAVILHLALVTGTLLGVTILLGLAFRLRGLQPAAARRAVLLLPAAGSYLLLLLYVADDVSNRLWIRHLNYETVWVQAVQLATRGTGLVPIPGWIYAVAGAGLLAWVAAWWALEPGISRGLAWIFAPGPPGRLFAAPRRATLTIAAAGVVWLATGSWLAAALATPQDLLSRYEPLTSFFLSVTDVRLAPRSAADTTLAARHSAERAAYRAPAAFDKRNVIVIMIDAARADHLQVYGYPRPTTPFLSRLKESGRLQLVTTAMSTCSESNCGIMSTLGSQPYRDQSMDNFKLHDVLRDQGYRLYFLLAGSHRWYGLKDYYAEKPDLLFDGTNSVRYPANDDRVLFDGLEQVPASDGSPAFFQFHLMSAHGTGIQQDRFRLFQPSGYSWTEAFTRQPDTSLIVNTYDNRLRQADAIIEELFATLDGKGYLANSLVVLLADHGEGFGEHGESADYFGHMRYLYQEHVAIPLMIYEAQPGPYRNLSFATQLDVAPTILDRLGLPIPPSWRGRSLLEPFTPRYTIHESLVRPGIQMAVFHTEGALYKLMQHGDGREELFEVVSDPAERRNLVSEVPAVAGRLREELEKYRHGH
jgi:hypothetical protein